MRHGQMSGDAQGIDETTGFWRDGEHGGMNALFVLLRLNGYSESYTAALSATHERGLPNAIPDILQVASQLGHPLAARQLAPRELDDLPLPVIVHINGDTPKSGRFVLLVQVQPNYIRYFDGSLAIIQVMDRESFFRNWSGVALLPGSASDPWGRQMIAAMVAGLAVAFCLKAFSLKRRPA